MANWMRIRMVIRMIVGWMSRILRCSILNFLLRSHQPLISALSDEPSSDISVAAPNPPEALGEPLDNDFSMEMELY
ncbi:hypothetical protein B0F90DRAFT_1761264 [Multifurca ochricompacta]|uniref:Uncharacterized protein n=1 Tax=Multifurca ochricompacta TaxID=376703 RepID=A0AAD4LWY8_9AGAM|nr:hypothetical protein B0F90DRAFT_1761264 [Multifurca ochricompacta]